MATAAALKQASPCVAEADRGTWADSLVVHVHPGVQIADLPGRGRGLVATTAVKQGTLLLKEHPIVSVPAQSFSAARGVSEMCVGTLRLPCWPAPPVLLSVCLGM